ncbi:hypothetical protein Nepgr_024030 [Nepenthes gracilis]|uniref:Uncharacterized protein n=1 Tax=Nepenthes gracilis TaxID=150966 RepID=A0AAD3T511_NEPGR|nr:hypothetical protein Nepgr_024030 [Nepenthes gracilis]
MMPINESWLGKNFRDPYGSEDRDAVLDAFLTAVVYCQAWTALLLVLALSSLFEKISAMMPYADAATVHRWSFVLLSPELPYAEDNCWMVYASSRSESLLSYILWKLPLTEVNEPLLEAAAGIAELALGALLLLVSSSS